MGKYIALGLITAIIALTAVWYFDPAYQQQRADSAFYAAEAQRVQVAAQATQTALDVQRAQTTAPVWTGTTISLIILIPIVASLAVLATAGFLLRRLLLVRADHQGKLPTPLLSGMFPDLATDARGALAAWHSTQFEHAAQSSAVPHTYSPTVHYAPSESYAPRLDYRIPVPQQLTQFESPSLEAGLVPLALPDMVRLSDVLPSVPAGHMAYGMLTSGELLTIPLTDSFHTLLHGDTRSGKTNSIDAAIVQLHRQDNIRLVLGDFKRELAATWRRSPQVEAVETEPEHIAALLQEMVHGPDGILQRYTAFEQAASESGRVIRNLGEYQSVTHTTLRQTFIVVDELNAVIAAAGRDKTLSRSLQVALQTGAGAGCYILSGAQYLDAATFGRSGSKQFVTRAHFGALDQTALRMIFNGAAVEDEQKALLDGSKGRGLIKVVGQPAPVAFQALRCDESDILEAIGQRTTAVHGRTAPSILADMGEILEPENAARTASERSERGCGYTPEQADIVRRLRDAGRGKAETVQIVFGATKGGSSAYKQASNWYDLIVAGGAA